MNAADAQHYVLAGAGKMGFAMLEGWLRQGLPPASITIVDPHPSAQLQARCKETGISLNPPPAATRPADVIILAIKPQMLESAGPDLARIAGAQTLVISIMAGKSIHAIAAQLPQATAIIRCMPNTPAAVGRGITGLYANAAVNAAQKAIAQSLMTAIGKVVFVDDESQIDAVTAVSGSGPAYLFYLVECLANAGVHLGLAPELAMQLARATVEGSGELLHQSAEVAAGQLRVNVTSPGGTTAAALAVLMDAQGLDPLMQTAVQAAYDRARQLAD